MSSTKPSERLFFLVDCNQFFVSCEQLFQPKLYHRPVVVLSSNDGCVVSRSKEAKALDIPMGAPAFKFRALFREHHVHVFSSNFSLYGNLSRRVMDVLYSFSPDVEEYSVDEAFLHLSTKRPEALAVRMREKVLKWTGIPVSIGVGRTKTLAKLASDLSKKDPRGILVLDAQADTILRTVDVHEIWGVGPALSAGLKAHGIHTALALKHADAHWLSKRFSTTLMQTVLELKGLPCLTLDNCPCPRKSLTCSRSFGEPTENLHVLEEALASYTAHAAETLRSEALLASVLTVFLMTSPFLQRSYSNSATLALEEPTHYSPTLITKAKRALKGIFLPHYPYKKVGIVLGGFVVEESYQPDLFDSDAPRRTKRTKAMETLDHIQMRFGTRALRFAAEGCTQKTRTRSDHCSPRYTTSWDELLTINL